jgi:hypothetical protein
VITGYLLLTVASHMILLMASFEEPAPKEGEDRSVEAMVQWYLATVVVWGLALLFAGGGAG